MTNFPRSEPAEQLPPFESVTDFRPFRQEDFERSVVELFFRACDEHPSRTALVGTQTLSYQQLQQRCERVAQHLHKLDIQLSEPVAILAVPDTAFVIAALGILRAGGCFLPLDPHQPEALLCKHLEHSGAHVLIAEDSQVSRARALCSDLQLLDLGQLLADDSKALPPQDSKQSKQPAWPQADATACLFYTSGSTGEPLGVPLDHGLLSFDACRQTNDLAVSRHDRFDLLFSPAFSASLAPIFTALINGASLHFLDLKARGVSQLPEWLVEQEISISNQSSSTLRALLNLLQGRDNLPKLRLLCSSAESLQANDCARVQTLLHKDCILQNAMASTETRTYAQLFLRQGENVNDPVPIGYPVLGRTIRLLDEKGHEAEQGEIEIVARHMAHAYRYAPALSHARFQKLEDGRTRYRTGDRARKDSNGRLVYLGRGDSIAKVRGYRVDISEVQRHVQAAFPQLETCALAYRDPRGDTAIGLALQANSQLDLRTLRTKLAPELPEYSLPTQLLELAKLPRNANNKLDRMALRERLEANPKTEELETESTDALSPSESALSAIWADVLHQAQPNLEQDYFESGGDSLSSVILLTEIEQRLGERISHQDLLNFPSIRSLAAFIDSGARQGSHIVDLPSAPHTSATPEQDPPTAVFLLPAITGHTPALANIAGLSTSQCSFHLLTAIPSKQAPDDEYSIAWVASIYAKELQELAPSKSIVLVGFSWGAFVAHELACQLQAAGISIRLLILLDSRLHKTALPRPLPRWRQALTQIANVPAWIRYDLLTENRHKLSRRIAGAFAQSREKKSSGGHTEQTAHKQPNLQAYFGHAGFNQDFAAEFYARYQAALRFRPRNWKGPTAVYRARAQSLTDPRPGALGWEHFVTPAPDVHTIPGHHESFLQDPHVNKLVRSLDVYLP